MVVRSDSDLSFIPVLLLTLISFFGVFISFTFVVERQFRSAAKTLAGVACLIAVFVFIVIIASFLTPQRIINIGDSYCEDIWCIGVESVSVEPRAENTEVNVAVRIFSDANTTDISAKGVSLYLLDEGGRRFPLVANPAAVPFDMTLKPRQSINTLLTFIVASDARQLFLTGVRGGASGGGQIPVVARILVSLYLGSDTSLAHKPTLLRVL